MICIVICKIAPTRRNGFTQLFAASHPAHQLLEKGIPQTMFVNVCDCVCVCVKKGKEGGGRLSVGDFFAVSVRL